MMRWDDKISEVENKYLKYEKVHPFCYCAMSGVVGGQNILFGKMVATLIGNNY